jgi:hypothetical protein
MNQEVAILRSQFVISSWGVHLAQAYVSREQAIPKETAPLLPSTQSYILGYQFNLK